MPKVTLMCHPEAKPKDLANEKEILRFAQNDSFAVTLAHFYGIELWMAVSFFTWAGILSRRLCF